MLGWHRDCRDGCHPGPSASPTIAAINQTGTPVGTGTGPDSNPVAPTQASLPPLVAITGVGDCPGFLLGQKETWT